MSDSKGPSSTHGPPIPRILFHTLLQKSSPTIWTIQTRKFMEA
ncbi:hypothetical protein BofuT4_uP159750.1 [Botrytis cinerea T4]|uniref:Uncharacterized protein n=1 Tax=Botryotinia fuckeliana (strain T4) TaxID=999810 RepID=G2YU56_BOTF4|nr:hypothetical protein BofuT4_uP159750.1 [Botrytis cinerea T4]